MADKYDALGAKGKGPKGADLMSARDAIQEDIFNDAFWCWYCYYCGEGCMGPFDKGCILAIGEVCCCAGTAKSATCCDGDGCIALTTKVCCALEHMELPPSNTPGVGCCGFTVGGNLDKDPSSLSPQEQEELELLKTTFWCISLYCVMLGCNSPGGSDPCYKLEGKLCCVWANVETDSCCDDGWIECTEKVCCFVNDCSYPAGRTPGFVICGMTLCCENLPNKENAAAEGS